MPITSINEVLFMGGCQEDYASGQTGMTYPPYSGSNVYWRPGTVRCAVAGDLVINLPRKIATPDILCIHASLFIPASPTTGWQGKQILTFRDGGVPKLGMHMFGNAISAGQSWHYWNGSGQKTSLFGLTSGIYDGFANVGGIPSALVQGTLQRRTWVVRYDAIRSYPENDMTFDTIKTDWSTGSTSPGTAGLSVLGGSTGIDSIVLGSLEGALWSEVIVTLESTIPGMSSYGGNRLYMLDLPPNGEGTIDYTAGVVNQAWFGTYDRLDEIALDFGASSSDANWTNASDSGVGYTVTNLPHPSGIVTGSGNPGDPWTGGYEGVEDGYTWTWEPYGVKVSATGQTETHGPLSSVASGPDELAVGVRSNGVQEFGTPQTMPTYTPDTPYIYGTVSKIWEDNPATGQRWTLDEINDLTIAMKANF